MNKEILMVVDAVSNEKGVDKEVIFEALEAALASATRKKYGEEMDARVIETQLALGHFELGRIVGEHLPAPERVVVAGLAIDLDARDLDAKAEIGGFVEQPIESVAFGRIAAQQAKQVIVQKVRES